VAGSTADRLAAAGEAAAKVSTTLDTLTDTDEVRRQPRPFRRLWKVRSCHARRRAAARQSRGSA
jgi:hypothetical protein